MIPDSPLKIAVVTLGRQLQPLAGGELRTHHLARSMARLGSHVNLFAFVLRNHPTGESRPLSGFCARQLHALPLDLAALSGCLGLPMAVSLPSWLRLLRGRLTSLLSAGRYDIVQFEFPWFVEAYPAIGGKARVIYGAHNIESQYWLSALASRLPGKRWIRRIQASETRAAREAAGVTVCSEDDRGWMLAHGGLSPDRVVVVPNGFDACRLRPPTGTQRESARTLVGVRPDESLLLFVGHNTAPNREAASLLIEMMVTAPAGWRLALVGRIGEALGYVPAGRVLHPGQVADVLPWLHAADLALNPMMSGSGSNLKLVEALAAGLPVVTTRFGLRGFETLRPYVVLAEPPQFMEAIGQALDHRPPSPPRDALEDFSWDSLAARQLAFYRLILSSRQP